MKKKKIKKRSFLMYPSEYIQMFHSEETMWWYRGLRNLIEEYLVKFSCQKILDAGCGTGKTMEYMSSKGFLVSGIDYSKKALAFCRRRRLRNIRYGSLTKLPFLKKSFDAVLCIDVLGSLTTDRDMTKAIAECNRVLKPGGILIVQCAALEWLRSPHDTVTNFRKRFYKKELEEYFSTSDWKIIKSSYRVFFMFPPILAVRLVKKLLIKNEETLSDQYVPHPVLNWIFTRIQLVENRMFTTIDFSIGSSLFLVFKKKKDMIPK